MEAVAFAQLENEFSDTKFLIKICRLFGNTVKASADQVEKSKAPVLPAEKENSILFREQERPKSGKSKWRPTESSSLEATGR